MLLAVLLAAFPGTAAEWTESPPLAIDPTEPLRRAQELTPQQVLTAKPDLDLGWQDHLELRCTIARDFSGNLEIRYRCVPPSGETMSAALNEQSPWHQLILPAALLRCDGLPHTYRIDMGLQPGWRGQLSEIVLPAALHWQALRCGDGAGEDDLTSPIDPEWQHRKIMESKHFRLFYGKGLSRDMTDADAHGTLRNFEESWQVYVKVLQLQPPRPSEQVPGRRRKTNITTHRGGYDTGGGHINIDPSGLRVNPPSWVISHELMHAFQEVQGGKLAGMWWENHADYGTERVLRWWRDYFPPQSEDGRHGPPTAFNPAFSTMAHWYLGHGRDYYLCWPIWTYLDENPDHLPGLGNGISSTIWQQHRDDENLFTCLQRLAPQLDLAHMLGCYARRNASWSYANGAAMRRVSRDFLREQPWARRWIESDLLPLENHWFRVPPERAPQPGAYTVHALALPPSNNAEIRYELRGLAEVREQDWRVSCVALDDDDAELAHSNVGGVGQHVFRVPNGTARLLLVVCATPQHFDNWEQNDLLQPWRDHSSRRRFHYALRFDNTHPVTLNNEVLHHDVPGAAHANGGGFVAASARVAATAYVGPQACVLDQAEVREHARIDDHAVIKDQAIVSNQAIVRDHVLVCDQAQVRDSARLLQRAMIKETARVGGNATVEGQAEVWSLPADDPAARQRNLAAVAGDAILTGDYAGGRVVRNGVQTGFTPYLACEPEWIAARRSPAHQWLHYGFDAAPLAIIRDDLGLTDADLLGAPDWIEGASPHCGVQRFNGRDQALRLPTSALDLQRGTLAVWFNWSGSSAEQTLFFVGNDAATLLFTPANLDGRAELRITHQQRVFRITCPRPLPRGQWIHLAVSLDGAKARLFINGSLAVANDLPLCWMDFRPSRQQIGTCYIARHRDTQRPWFQGALDDLRVWCRALTDSEIAAAARLSAPQPDNHPTHQPKNHHD